MGFEISILFNNALNNNPNLKMITEVLNDLLYKKIVEWTKNNSIFLK